MREAGVPTAAYDVFEDLQAALHRVDEHFAQSDAPLVIKADGEAAGKGVFVAPSHQEAEQALKTIMVERAFGHSGDLVVVEEFLEGQEATLMCFVAGESFAPMPPAQDYKRAYDGDRGPNTGGMGCYAPVPAVTSGIYRQAVEKIIRPMLAALKERGIDYRGVLYAGIVLSRDGPKVLEFNCRFGDPETQVVLPLLETDLVDIVESVIAGRLDESAIKWYNKKAVCVVVASGGYPGEYETSKPILGLAEAESTGAIVFHAGTRLVGAECVTGGSSQTPGRAPVGGQCRVVTAGGRVLGITGVGDTYAQATDIAYRTVGQIHFDNMHYRKDIAAGVK